MCSPLNPLSCSDAIAKGLSDPVTDAVTALVTNNLTAILNSLAEHLHVAISASALFLAGWILVPSTQVCSQTGVDWVGECASGSNAAAQVRGWMLPITALVAVVGILWQALTMVITRKGEPLLNVLKGLFSVAVWGVVGIAGTQLAMRAGDSYSYWILQQAVFGDSLDPVADLGKAIENMSAGASYTAVLLLIFLSVPFLFCAIAQIILMIFRDGAVVILAGQIQLAAAGGFTRLTSGWLPKLTGWMLALIAYKPVAASVYAVAFTLMGDNFRNVIMGLAVMVMALIAMPALMKFFNWGVGSIASQSNGLGMLGTSMAAGIHGASAMRGLGGHNANDHARWLATHGPGSGGGGGPAGPTEPSSPPRSPPPGGLPGGGGGSPAPMSSPSSSAASSMAGGAGASAAAGAASGGAAVAAQAAVTVVKETKQKVHRAATAAGDAMGGK